MIDRSALSTTRVLVDNPYFAVALQRHSRCRPVMVWAPEVRFVFNPRLSASAVTRSLRAENVGLVAVQIKSSNNPYLSRYPFYAEDAKNLTLGWSVPGLDAVFLLHPFDQGYEALDLGLGGSWREPRFAPPPGGRNKFNRPRPIP